MTTFFTFIGVCGSILTFAVPILIYELVFAVIVDIVWGILLIVALNIYIAKLKNESAIKLVIEHVSLAVVVKTISYFTGKLIGGWIQ